MAAERKILIVEDILINRKLLRKILENEYSVLEAENGAQAFEVLEAAQNSGGVAAILLDLVMPVMDGYEFLRRYRDAQKYSAPVIVVSQKETGEAEIEALSYGAADFLTKPYNPRVIKQRVKNLIALRETSSIITAIERDALTGLYTKEFFAQVAAEQLAENPNTHYDLCCVDIENFKLVNDLFGFDMGNLVLRKLAQEFRAGLVPSAVCGRQGGDVFVALFPRPETYEEIGFADIAARLNNPPIGITVTPRFGIYQIHDRTLPIDAMCDRAILAEGTIKGKYESYYALYDNTIREKLILKQKINDTMKSSLENGDFMVYLQPKYNLLSGKIAGAEALVRWKHPEMGFLSPAAFIPQFEKNGFITDLDAFVWKTVCETVQHWKAVGITPVTISANVSRVDIYRAQLPQLLMNLVREHGLQPSDMNLEITESAYTKNPAQLIETVGELKNEGFRIEMDDFGTGYSSLNMLSELPIDVVKLDVKFIQQHKQRRGKSMLGFIVSLAKWMGLSIVAEGVEEQEQIDLLRSLDCDLVQGYYYAKPMPIPEFEELMRREGVARETARHPDEIAYPPIVMPADDSCATMLVVDDVEINRAMLTELFHKMFRVVQFSGGADAIAYLQEHADETAVILLDLMMPGMDGFQVLEALRKNDATREIPVIVTSVASETSESRALAMGAEDFVTKPYEPYLTKRRVANVVTTRRLKKQAKAAHSEL